MDSKEFGRISSNGIAAGREDSRWKDERIAELTRQRDSYRHSANDLATRCARDEERIEELEAERRELVEVLRERDGGIHDTDCPAYRAEGRPCRCGHEDVANLLAKIDASRT